MPVPRTTASHSSENAWVQSSMSAQLAEFLRRGAGFAQRKTRSQRKLGAIDAQPISRTGERDGDAGRDVADGVARRARLLAARGRRRARIVARGAPRRAAPRGAVEFAALVERPGVAAVFDASFRTCACRRSCSRWRCCCTTRAAIRRASRRSCARSPPPTARRCSGCRCSLRARARALRALRGTDAHGLTQELREEAAQTHVEYVGLIARRAGSPFGGAVPTLARWR